MRGDLGGAREGVQGSTAEPLACAGDRRRVGGRFWALATDDEEDAEDDGAEPPVESPPSPSPSDLICEFFHSGYSEEEVATTVDRVVPPEDLARAGLQAGDKVEIIRRIVHQKTSASALRPWKGPIPKVSLPKLTVFDLIRPEEWVTVKRKKKMRSSPRGSRSPAPAVAAAAAAIQTSRAAALARLLRAAGPERSVATDVGVGPDQHGYAAHVSSEAHTGFSIEPCTFNHRDSIAPAPSVEGARVRRSQEDSTAARDGWPGDCASARGKRRGRSGRSCSAGSGVWSWSPSDRASAACAGRGRCWAWWCAPAAAQPQCSASSFTAAGRQPSPLDTGSPGLGDVADDGGSGRTKACGAGSPG